MIAPESLRASRTRWEGRDVLTFEWCSTTGGEHPRTHHHARSLVLPDLNEHGAYGTDQWIEDTLGPGGDLFFQMGGTWPDDFYARTYRVGIPPTLREQYRELPVVETPQLLACGFYVLRASRPFRDHKCWVEAMRDIKSGEGPLKDVPFGHAMEESGR